MFKEIKRFNIFIGFILSSQLAFANPPSPPSNDPYTRTIYTNAFKQDEIWKKYKKVLEAEKLEHLLENPNLSLVQRYAPEELEQSSWISSLSSYFSWGRYQRVPEEARQDSLPELAFRLNKELVGHFLTNKKDNAHQTLRDELWATGSYCVITGGLLGTSTVVLPASMTGIAAGFGTFVIANQIATSVYTTVKEYIRIKNYAGDPLLPYEIQYAVYKRYIDPKLWQTIEDSFSIARTNPYNQEKIFKFFNIVFNLPREKRSFLLIPPRQAVENPNEEAIFARLKYTYDNLVTTIDSLFGEDYRNSTEIRLMLKTGLWEHIMASAGRPHTRQNILLVGKAGTGKTRLWDEIPKRTGIPLVSIDLRSVSEPSQITGTADEPGLLLEALATSPVINPILLSDEASEVLNDAKFEPTFKGLTEPKNGTFRPPFLKFINANFQDLLWVSAGNSGIKGREHDLVSNAKNPLASRFNIGEMPEFTDEFIRRQAEEKVAILLKNHVYITEKKNAPQWALAEYEKIVQTAKNPRELDRTLPHWCMKVNEEERVRQQQNGPIVEDLIDEAGLPDLR